jgi:hypothetical protein
MPADNRPALVAATRQRARDTRARARAAIRQLDHQGLAVTFAAVAAAAKTSRSLLYRDADIRAEIQRLRARQPSRTSRLPAAQRTSDTSLQQRLATLLDDNRALRDENRKLRDQIAALLGEQRATTTPTTRRRARTIGPCS